jgi:hypothetical protein
MTRDAQADKDAALVACAEFEAIVTKHRLPCVVLIGLPATGETVRFWGGLASPDNRAAVRIMFESLMVDAEREGR